MAKNLRQKLMDAANPGFDARIVGKVVAKEFRIGRIQSPLDSLVVQQKAEADEES